MTKSRFKIAITLGVLLTAAIVIRNYFWGDTEQQQRSREILGQVTALTESVVDLLRSEKEEFQDGKYDQALAKVKSTFAVLRKRAAEMGDEGLDYLKRVAELEERERQLEERLRNLESESVRESDRLMATQSGASADVSSNEARAVRREILNINEEAERLTLLITDSGLQN